MISILWASRCRWDRAVCAFMCLAYFTLHNNDLQVDLCCCKWQNELFLRLNNVLCIHIHHVFIHHSIWCILILAIMNNLGVSMVVQVSLRHSRIIFLGNIPKGQIGGSHGSSIFKFWGTFTVLLCGSCTDLYSCQQHCFCINICLLTFWQEPS